MALTLLPETMFPTAWNQLRNPLDVQDDSLTEKMVSFVRYFDRTWINGSFPLNLWCHHDNVGPRTTNQAEGWHNSINHSFGVSHPAAATFLHWLQRHHFEIQCRQIQLQSGRPPKQRSSTYVELDQRIFDAKLQFGLRTGNIICNLFPQPVMWTALSHEITLYLRHVSYLIGAPSV